MRYQVELTPDENGTLIAVIPAIPGAMTVGKDADEALDMALDAALTMLAAMMDDGEDIPQADEPEADHAFVELPPMVVVKMALYQAMKDQGVSQLKLAARLHTDPKSVRRLLDLFHASRWDHLEMALEGVGLPDQGPGGTLAALSWLLRQQGQGSDVGMSLCGAGADQ